MILPVIAYIADDSYHLFDGDGQMAEQGKVVAVASSKGGVGKSSYIMAVASALAKSGLDVGILDNDPNQPVTEWLSENPVQNITAKSKVSDTDVFETLDKMREMHDIVLADMEGSANLGVAHAIACADLVVVPSQGSSLDHKEAAKTLRLINSQSKMQRREIPYRILFTRTNQAITPRTLRKAYEQLRERKIPYMKTEFYNLEAFKVFVGEGRSLYDLTDEEAPNLTGARKVLKQLAAELIAVLKDPSHGIEVEQATDADTTTADVKE
jgi:chromosome partitioning protein